MKSTRGYGLVSETTSAVLSLRTGGVLAETATVAAAGVSFTLTLSAAFSLTMSSGSSVAANIVLSSTFALAGSVSAVSGQFVSKILANNTGSSPLASTSVVWEWRQGTGIGVAPTSVVYGTGTTDSTGKFTATGLPAGAGELWMATTDYLNVYYERGTVA